MRKEFCYLLLFIILIITNGCHRLAAQPTLDLSQLTPVKPTQDAPITPTPAPTFDLATGEALRLYPLLVGSTWVYEYLGYDQNQEVVWRVVETVTNTRFVDGYYVAELERTAKLLDGDPPSDFLSSPDTGTIWYLVDGQNLYLFEINFSTSLSDAWLDLILPFPGDSRAWFPDPDRRAVPEKQTSGFRYASEPFKKVLPMGGTYTCYNVATRYIDGVAEGTFCETVGFVYKELKYDNRIFGYSSELIGFTLQ